MGLQVSPPKTAAEYFVKVGEKEQTPQPAQEEALAKVEEKEDKEEPAKSTSRKDVEQMADAILDVISEKPPPKPKAKAKAKASTKKAAAKPTVQPEEPPSKKSKATFPFPGEGPGKPIRYCNVTIYLCPKSPSYRVKLAGEKKDKTFSWKMDGPKQAWSRVRQRVLSVSV